MVKRYNLSLSAKEAAVLLTVYGMIAGDPQYSARRHADSVYRRLKLKGCDVVSAEEVEGRILFHDYPPQEKANGRRRKHSSRRAKTR